MSTIYIYKRNLASIARTKQSIAAFTKYADFDAFSHMNKTTKATTNINIVEHWIVIVNIPQGYLAVPLLGQLNKRQRYINHQKLGHYYITQLRYTHSPFLVFQLFITKAKANSTTEPFQNLKNESFEWIRTFYKNWMRTLEIFVSG